RAQQPAANPTEVDRELRGEWSGGELRQSEPVFVVLGFDPAALLDEVALHVAAERDRPAEPERPETEEVPEELRQRAGLHRGPRRLLSGGLDGAHEHLPPRPPFTPAPIADRARTARRSASSLLG